jgi:hypothetical protein
MRGFPDAKHERAFEVVERRRLPLFFFAVGNSHDPEWREMGAQLSLGMNDVFAQLVKQYLPKLTSAAGKRRVEMAVRMSMAAVK